MPRLAIQARPYSATKPARPRTAASDTTTSGTIHNGHAPCLKPRSRKVFISIGISGSVAEPTTVLSTTASSAQRVPSK